MGGKTLAVGLLAGSSEAMRRARAAEDLAIKANTSILVTLDGCDFESKAEALIQWHQQEQQESSR
jgi:hypothetical protein